MTSPPLSPEWISACSSRSRSCRSLVSSRDWSFLASWYSEFSFRSPHSRAVLMRSAISLRATVSRCSSSACSAWCASAVMTTRAGKTDNLVLGLEAGAPFAVVADRHQRVGHAGAEHEIARVADEGERGRRARHGDRRAAALGKDGLQLLPHERRLRCEDRDAVDGGLHGRQAYTNIRSHCA